jgi:HlyD family secretion protein
MIKNVIGRLKSINRWVLLGAALLIVGLVVVAVVKLGQPPEQTAATDQTVKAFTGDLSGSINGSGHLEPEQKASLSMATTGIITQVKVKVGDQVKAGDVLVQLDDADAQQALQKAQVAVQQAQISVDSAQYDYDSKTGWSPNDSQLAAAVASMANSQAAVKAAQSDYDKVRWLPFISATPQSLALEQATNNFTKAKADLDYVLSNRPSISPARLALENAKLSLSSSEIDLASAKNALAKTTLQAPFAGTVTAVNVSVGETASGPVVEMATMNTLNVVLDVDEVDIGAIEINQPALITFDAYPGAQAQGHVTSIPPKAEAASSTDIVQYKVKVTIDKADVKLLVGMTASATIQTYQLKGVLLAPNSAIFPNRDNGTYYVNLITKDGVKKTDVTIGAHNTEYTQILAGIEDGAEMQVNDTTPLLDITNPRNNGGGN